MSGCIHIYCGDGKGKTTAAVGLAIRAAGRSKTVFIARFMKTDDSGEVEILKRISEITLYPCEKTFGFYWQMSESQKEEAAIYYTELLERIWKAAVDDGADMIVLDEIMAACNYELVKYERLLDLISRKPDGLEVVLTGRNPRQDLMDSADYVTEMRAVKHPYEKGVPARIGIEY